ncbi:MerR family transcriptional regulator [Lacticaseibacillus parakribbianus]|uniref:MerR family transcriptional regulator n=1 Tax=Lacticaseibacillus parakribbianus TaxID=2970927 RepID=UPI0021CB6BBB|nr:MerR family transcriptional regulator [Lacticaseibacillus parakribbianus]
MTEISDLRNRPVLPIGTVIALTDLTARQIRYYEAQDLIHPERSQGNHRLYALRDVDALLDIRSQLAAGFTLADIRRQKQRQPAQPTSDSAVRHMLRSELMNQGRLNPSDRNFPTQGFGFRN